jgi:hypothetical protein
MSSFGSIGKLCEQKKTCWEVCKKSNSSKVFLGLIWAVSLILLITSIVVAKYSGGKILANKFTKYAFPVSVLIAAVSTILMVPVCMDLRIPAVKPQKPLLEEEDTGDFYV